MPQFLKPTPPVVSASASFHADQASRLLLEKREQLASTELATHENTTALIDTVDLENAFREVDTDSNKLGHGRLLSLRRQHPDYAPTQRREQEPSTPSIEWPQLPAVIRFKRAGGRCEVCRRPHGQTIFHLGDGRWWDREALSWRNEAGRFICLAVGADDVLGTVRTTRVVLAAAHRDHDTSNNAPKNLAAFCQRCHMNHDRPEHMRRRWRTLFRRKALGDLFRGPYG